MGDFPFFFLKLSAMVEEEQPETAPNSPRHSDYDTENTEYAFGSSAEYDTVSAGEETPSDSDDDCVQCTVCYKMYHRDQWSSWPVESGFETACALCVQSREDYF